ncbi:protein Mis18-alpha-like [Leptodactylus fuscus]|uniref:protein Mis18-alpha-like n=1 Tax=Leptodactylus fuscus TaxID=238119 RepID=UPI003F4F229D
MADLYAVTSLQSRPASGTVYICCNCRVPVGDNSDWSGKHNDDNVVLLRVVTQFVKRGKLMTSRDPHDAGSRYRLLSCNNCSNVLGRFYSSTPAHLEYKLNLFNIDNNAIQEYIFGLSYQQAIETSEAPITLELCDSYEEELKKQKLLLEMLLKRLSKLEDEISPTGQGSSENKMTA